MEYIIAGLVVLGLAAVYFNSRKSAKSNIVQDPVPYKIEPEPAPAPEAPVVSEVIAPVEQKMEAASVKPAKAKKPRAKKSPAPKAEKAPVKTPRTPKPRKPKMTIVK